MKRSLIIVSLGFSLLSSMAFAGQHSGLVADDFVESSISFKSLSVGQLERHLGVFSNLLLKDGSMISKYSIDFVLGQKNVNGMENLEVVILKNGQKISANQISKILF